MGRVLMALVLMVAGCGEEPTRGEAPAAGASDGSGAEGGDGASAGGGAGGDGDGSTSGGGVADGDDCQPPDMLIVLDRTLSMHRKVDGTAAEDTPAGRAASKWALAISAVESMVGELDATIRFGLELFPQDPGGGACVSLSARIQGEGASNPQCQGGEVLVPPGLAVAGAVSDQLDPETTLLCRSTPIGAGLSTAAEALSALADPVREQYGVLITDGRDTCGEEKALRAAHAMAREGVRLYAIGFDGSGKGIDRGHLNDLACAGRTAKGFPGTCADDGSGDYVAAERDGDALFISADDEAALLRELRAVAGQVCCNCLI